MDLEQEKVEQLKELWHKYFKESYVRYSNIWGYAYMNFCIGSGENEWYNTYKENDMLHLCFEITSNGTDYCIKANNNYYKIKPQVNKWLCYESKNVRFVKIVGNWDKVLERMDKFFAKLHNQLKEDLDNGIISYSDGEYLDCFNRNVSHTYILRKHLA